VVLIHVQSRKAFRALLPCFTQYAKKNKIKIQLCMLRLHSIEL